MPDALRWSAPLIAAAQLTAATAVLTAATAAEAQPDPSRLVGRVSDSSGGALPGVTVTITPRTGSSVSVVTDGSGEYRSPALPPGAYQVVFELSGFEASEVRDVALRPGEAFILDRQLGLASLAETVEVIGITPKPPPPRPRPPMRRRPQPQPVAPEVLASVCGPSQPADSAAVVGRIAAHRDDLGRQLFGNGDVLVLDTGANHDVAVGMNLAVRRRFRLGDRSLSLEPARFGEHTSALVQVMEVDQNTSVAVVVYACDEFEAGDTVERFQALPAFEAVETGQPHYDNPARILFGDQGREMASVSQLMVIDRGASQGAQRGQRLTVFRRALGSRGGPVTPIADAIIVIVRSLAIQSMRVPSAALAFVLRTTANWILPTRSLLAIKLLTLMVARRQPARISLAPSG